ncbi:unnamed protein product [Cuscuta campestris]|uniref:Glucose-methanol-choline oxidoreductase N-terminal domain-containing protein n=1 Tax=Cuscuta campestris TaxID=132261 RepID=A0A484MVK1_9ASTE|nr:unnamed protein product [Cuscuta campestris]
MIPLELQNFRTNMMNVIQNLINAPLSPPNFAFVVTVQNTESHEKELRDDSSVESHVEDVMDNRPELMNEDDARSNVVENNNELALLEAPYTSFAKDATSAAVEAGRYNYIIIGGGTAGCALAATLSSAAKVLLLERGGLPYDNQNVTHISGFAPTLTDASPTSASQLFVSTDGVILHRGRVLGGSSAINAGFFTRASNEDVAEAGWDPHMVNESYVWAERKVAFRPDVVGWQAAVKDGLLEAGVRPYNGWTNEHLHGTKIGSSIFDESGYRHTAADLLEYADETKITLYLHAVAHQILFERPSLGQKPRAYGVFFRDSRGVGHTAFLNGGPNDEIILSAGAIGSPQLLMLSGIGPSDHLKAHGIDVILDQQMVGQGMSDNPMNGIVVPSVRPVETSLVQVVGITDFGSYIEAGSGMYLSPKALQALNQAFFQDTKLQAGNLFEKVKGPFSQGHLELESKDPNENPRVTFNYFKDSRDLERCVQGMEVIRKVVESEPVSAFKYPFTTFESLLDLMVAIPVNLRPKLFTSATGSLEQFCIDTVTTIWHYHGGCQVDRVVDRDYKVIGVDALRVIDGSTLLNSPGTNPQATLMMLGRYMGQKILQQRARQ